MKFEMKRERGVFRIFVDDTIRSNHKFKMAAQVEPGPVYSAIECESNQRCRVYTIGEKSIIIDFYDGNKITVPVRSFS